MKYVVRELPTKELYIINGKGKSFYIEPKFGLDKCLEVLKQINSLKTKNGKFIYEAYCYKGHYVFSFFQEHLAHDIIEIYLRYKEFIDMLKPGDELLFMNKGNFKILWPILNNQHPPFIKRRFKNTLLDIFNLLLRFKPKKMLFFDYGKGNFRVLDVTKEIDDANISYARVGPNRKKDILQLTNMLYLGYKHPSDYTYQEYKGLENVSLFKIEHLVSILKHIDRLSQDSIEEIKRFEKLLGKSKIKVLYSVLDTRVINSLLVACKLNNITTYGHQHGIHSKYNFGWMQHGIPEKYGIAFDKLTVWSEYWKKKLTQYSSVYNENNVEIGCPIRNKDYHISKNKTDIRINSNTLNIMIPYEFLASNIEIGKYIDYFIEKKGWNVILKLRPDEPTKQQLECYKMKNIHRVSYSFKYSSNDLERIDVVAGTHTTLLYEMIEYNKPIWYLKTAFNMAEDIVNDGIAHYIDFDILEKATDFSKFLNPRYRKDTNYYFNRSITLKEIVKRLGANRFLESENENSSSQCKYSAQ